MTPINNDFETKVTLETPATPIPETPPFHVLFMGDYSGRDNSSTQQIHITSQNRIMEIDRDNFGQVMKDLDVKLLLDLQQNGQNSLNLNFRNIDDFHPDNIFQKVPIFSELRQIRKNLIDSDTFEKTARKVRSLINVEDSGETAKTETKLNDENQKSEIAGNLLDDILESKNVDADIYQDKSQITPELNALIRDVVKPHLVFTDESEQSRLIKFIDQSISELMLLILHHPDFKAIESAWRGLYLAVRRTETSRTLKLFIMDISKYELSSKLKLSNTLEDTQVYKQLLNIDALSHSEPWALICGNYNFELNVDDVASLIRIAKICSDLTAPFISHIDSSYFNLDSSNNSEDRTTLFSDQSKESKLWNTLRTFPEADSLGFVLPNFLSRLPYGKETEPIEAFYFEEFSSFPESHNYLWTNSSYLLAILISRNFVESDWNLVSGFSTELEGFPTHIYTQNGETKTQSCLEYALSRNDCETIIDHGLIPFVNFRDTDKISLIELKSISRSLSRLNGRWV